MPVRFEPHGYQRRAIAFIEATPRCALFMGMGMGKSAVALTAAADLLRWGEARRVLVVAPKKVAETTWGDEASKWEHLGWLRVARCLGAAARRRAALAEGADVTVVGRDSFVWLLAECGKSWPFDMIVIDELSGFKSRGSLRSKAMRKASAMASRVVGLTGTPAPNGLLDLWAQMACVDGGATLGRSFTAFRERFFTWRLWNSVPVDMRPKPGAEEEIRRLLAPSALAMEPSDYLDMPPMAEEDAWVALGEAGLKAYARFARDRVAELGGAEVTAASAAALACKLAQWANGFVYDDGGLASRVNSAKLEMLAEVYEEARACGSGLLVFYQFVEDRRSILERFPEARAYVGSADLEAWNAGGVPMLLAHPASAGYGLNMQRGGHCVAWFGLTWNLELYQQANARLHRQGQQRPVCVKRILARGTVDEKMAAALARKEGGQRALIEGMKRLVEECR